MKLRDAILLSLTVGFLIIGIHQTMTLGFAKAYWVLMLSLLLFFAYGLLKKPKSAADTQSAQRVKNPGKSNVSKQRKR